TAFYNGVTGDHCAEGTYFAVWGWVSGDFGLQERGGGEKVLIFSVWDQSQGNNPNDVPEKDRVRLIHQGEGVRIGRFGNEGTGGQSFFDYDWKSGQTYHFYVT